MDTKNFTSSLHLLIFVSAFTDHGSCFSLNGIKLFYFERTKTGETVETQVPADRHGSPRGTGVSSPWVQEGEMVNLNGQLDWRERSA